VKPRTLIQSFSHAADGLVHVLHTHRHMRYHFLIAAVVLLVSAILRVSRFEVLLLLTAITFVILAELVNTAVESAVDLASPSWHPLAKVAKDIGGAAVLVAILSAVVIAAGVFLKPDSLRALQGAATSPPPHFLHVALAGAVTVLVAVILGKLWGGRGAITRGGVVSAHSALAFFCLVSVWFLTPDLLIRGLAVILAILVAQSRVDTGIHTLREVIIGVAVALIIGVGLYGILTIRAG